MTASDFTFIDWLKHPAGFALHVPIPNFAAVATGIRIAEYIEAYQHKPHRSRLHPLRNHFPENDHVFPLKVY